MMRTAGKLKALIQNDEARPGNMKRLNDELKERLPGGEVEIDMELRDGVLSTGTEYKYAVFHFKKENRSIEARFFKEDVELKKKELKELGVKTTEDRRHFFNSPEHPALRGVWFVNATTAGDAKLNVQRIVTVTTADDVSKELLGEKAYKILIMAKRGLNVPSFFTIIGDGTGTLTITDEMRQLSSGMKKPMIVRSAHKDEGRKYPFSGIFQSPENISFLEKQSTEIMDPEDERYWSGSNKIVSVEAAYLEMVRDATDSPKTKDYLTQHGISDFDPKQMNAIVMEQKPLDIFAMFVTSSQEDPNIIAIDYEVRDPKKESQERISAGVAKYNKITRKLETAGLDAYVADMLARFGEQAVKVEELFGVQLVEMGGSNGKAYVFQARDIDLGNPGDVPRFVNYKTLLRDRPLLSKGYGYFRNLPVVVIDELDVVNPELKKSDEWLRLNKLFSEASARKDEEETGRLYREICALTDRWRDEYKAEMLRFKDAHPGYVLVMKNISDVVLRDSAGFFESNRDYSFLNKMVEGAKVVIKRDGHHAMLRHPDFDLIDRGGVDITINRDSRDIETFTAVPQQQSGDKKVSSMQWKGNVSLQYGGHIATGDHVTVLSNSDGFFIWFEEPTRPSSYAAAAAAGHEPQQRGYDYPRSGDGDGPDMWDNMQGDDSASMRARFEELTKVYGGKGAWTIILNELKAKIGYETPDPTYITIPQIWEKFIEANRRLVEEGNGLIRKQGSAAGPETKVRLRKLRERFVFPEELVREIDRLAPDTKGALICRSSGSLEDSFERNLAGIFISPVAKDRRLLAQAMKEVFLQAMEVIWARGTGLKDLTVSEAATAWRDSNSAISSTLRSEEGFGAVVQPFLEFDASGTAMSNFYGHTAIEAAIGDARTAVSSVRASVAGYLFKKGDTAFEYNPAYLDLPHTFKLKGVEYSVGKSRDDMRKALAGYPQIDGRPSPLSPAQARELNRVVNALEDAIGVPVDVEWGVLNSKLYIIQARPIIGDFRKALVEPAPELASQKTISRTPIALGQTPREGITANVVLFGSGVKADDVRAFENEISDGYIRVESDVASSVGALDIGKKARVLVDPYQGSRNAHNINLITGRIAAGEFVYCNGPALREGLLQHLDLIPHPQYTNIWISRQKATYFSDGLRGAFYASNAPADTKDLATDRQKALADFHKRMKPLWAKHFDEIGHYKGLWELLSKNIFASAGDYAFGIMVDGDNASSIDALRRTLVEGIRKGRIPEHGVYAVQPEIRRLKEALSNPLYPERGESRIRAVLDRILRLEDVADQIARDEDAKKKVRKPRNDFRIGVFDLHDSYGAIEEAFGKRQGCVVRREDVVIGKGTIERRWQEFKAFLETNDYDMDVVIIHIGNKDYDAEIARTCYELHRVNSQALLIVEGRLPTHALSMLQSDGVLEVIDPRRVSVESVVKRVEERYARYADAAPPAPPASAAPQKPEKLKVLVIDDEKDVLLAHRILFSNSLSETEYEFVYVESEEAAVKAMQDKKFDAALFDLAIPTTITNIRSYVNGLKSIRNLCAITGGVDSDNEKQLSAYFGEQKSRIKIILKFRSLNLSNEMLSTLKEFRKQQLSEHDAALAEWQKAHPKATEPQPAQVQAPPQTAAPQKPGKPKKLRVLIINDVPKVNHHLSRTLDRLFSQGGEYEYSFATNWSAAKGYLEQGPVDLIFTDYTLTLPNTWKQDDIYSILTSIKGVYVVSGFIADDIIAEERDVLRGGYAFSLTELEKRLGRSIDIIVSTDIYEEVPKAMKEARAQQLAAYDAALAEWRKSQTSSASAQKLKVLLASDIITDDFIWNMEDALSTSEYELHYAGDYGGALRKIRENPDLDGVIFDWAMQEDVEDNEYCSTRFLGLLGRVPRIHIASGSDGRKIAQGMREEAGIDVGTDKRVTRWLNFNEDGIVGTLKEWRKGQLAAYDAALAEWQKTNPQTSVPQPQPPKLKVLFVDDNEHLPKNFAWSVRVSLGEEQCDAFPAHSYDEAAKILEHNDIDLVVFDITMPYHDQESVRAYFYGRLKDIPGVVILSGIGDETGRIKNQLKELSDESVVARTRIFVKRIDSQQMIQQMAKDARQRQLAAWDAAHPKTAPPTERRRSDKPTAFIIQNTSAQAEDLAEYIQESSGATFNAITADSVFMLERSLREHTPNVVIVDPDLDDKDELDRVISLIVAKNPECRFIITGKNAAVISQERLSAKNVLGILETPFHFAGAKELLLKYLAGNAVGKTRTDTDLSGQGPSQPAAKAAEEPSAYDKALADSSSVARSVQTYAQAKEEARAEYERTRGSVDLVALGKKHGLTEAQLTRLAAEVHRGQGMGEPATGSGISPSDTFPNAPNAHGVEQYSDAILKGQSTDTAALALQTDDRAIHDLPEPMQLIFNKYEAVEFLQLLHNPSKSVDEIIARQKLITVIRDLPDNQRKLLIEKTDALYNLLLSIAKLLETIVRTEPVQLAEKSRYDAVKLTELLGKEKKGRANDEIDTIRACLAGIEQYKDSIEPFIKECSKIDDPIAVLLTKAFREKSAGFKAPGLQEVLDALKEDRRGTLEEISGNAISILSAGVKIGTFIRFASLTKAEGYGKATYDEGRPSTYEDGWNFMRRKDGQVQNPSGKDTRIKLLTGSNMSGKSFFLIQNLFIQLLGQTFGYIPAKSGNLRIYDQIVFIDRASTNSFMNLSAFGSEVKQWKDPLDHIGRKALYLVDEGFSTTSPEDQATLLAAASDLFREHGSYALFATHNEKFIAPQKEKPDVATYHFETVINKDALAEGEDKKEEKDHYGREKKEPVTFTHTLKEGFDDSKALEVAGLLGLQSSIIARAKVFLSGRAAALVKTGAKKIPAVTPYSEERREALKKERGSFLPFFPYEDVLVERENVPSIGGEPAPLEWKYDMGDRHHHRYYGYDNDRPKFEFDPVFALFSQDEDFASWSIEHVDYGLVKDQEILQGIHGLIMRGPSRDPADILERQRMFKALLDDKDLFKDGYWKSGAMINRLGTYLEAHELGAESPLDRFNLFMLLSALKDLHMWSVSKLQSELFLKILEMNLAMNGSSFEKAGVTGDVAKIRDIWKLQKEVEAFDRWYQFSKPKPKNDDPEVATKVKLLLAEAKRLTGQDHLGGLSYTSGAGRLVQPMLIDIFVKASGIKMRDNVPIELLTEMLGESDTIGNLKAVSALDPENWPAIEKALADLMPAMEKEENRGWGLFIPEHILFAQRLQALLYRGDALAEFLSWLRSYDSVHLHQIANYFEFVLGPMIGPFKNGREYLVRIAETKKRLDAAKAQKAEWERLVKAKDYVGMIALSAEHLKERQEYLTQLLKEKPSHTDVAGMLEHIKMLLKAANDGIDAVDGKLLKKAIEDFLIEDFGRNVDSARYIAKYDTAPRLRHVDFQQVSAEFSKLTRIFALAYIIKENGWHEVTLTGTPELDVKNAWSIVKTKKDQVRNSARFNSSEMARLYSGSNMSGKTFHLKQLIWAILAAQATGFAPCDGMTLPVFDKVLYIDRVKAESDRNISAFGLEAKYWKAFFENASRAGIVFGGVDEAGSTTSPRYQSALSYAIAEEMLGLGNMLAMASHNHDFLDAFYELNKSRVGIYHFKTHEGADGTVAFDYMMETGHAPSNAVKVAEKLGLGMLTAKIRASPIKPGPAMVAGVDRQSPSGERPTQGLPSEAPSAYDKALADSSSVARSVQTYAQAKEEARAEYERTRGSVDLVALGKKYGLTDAQLTELAKEVHPGQGMGEPATVSGISPSDTSLKLPDVHKFARLSYFRLSAGYTIKALAYIASVGGVLWIWSYGNLPAKIIAAIAATFWLALKLLPPLFVGNEKNMAAVETPDRIISIANRIAAAGDKPYTVRIVSSEYYINNSSRFTDTITLSSAVINALTDDELAMVIAHEVAHLKNKPKGFLVNPFFRTLHEELEADRDGFMIAMKAGFEADGALSAVEQGGSILSGNVLTTLRNFLFYSPPLTSERIAHIKAIIDSLRSVAPDSEFADLEAARKKKTRTDTDLSGQGPSQPAAKAAEGEKGAVPPEHIAADKKSEPLGGIWRPEGDAESNQVRDDDMPTLLDPIASGITTPADNTRDKFTLDEQMDILTGKRQPYKEGHWNYSHPYRYLLENVAGGIGNLILSVTLMYLSAQFYNYSHALPAVLSIYSVLNAIDAAFAFSVTLQNNMHRIPLFGKFAKIFIKSRVFRNIFFVLQAPLFIPHEIGHALAVIFTGGKILKFRPMGMLVKHKNADTGNGPFYLLQDSVNIRYALEIIKAKRNHGEARDSDRLYSKSSLEPSAAKNGLVQKSDKAFALRLRELMSRPRPAFVPFNPTTAVARLRDGAEKFPELVKELRDLLSDIDGFKKVGDADTAADLRARMIAICRAMNSEPKIAEFMQYATGVMEPREMAALAELGLFLRKTGTDTDLSGQGPSQPAAKAAEASRVSPDRTSARTQSAPREYAPPGLLIEEGHEMAFKQILEAVIDERIPAGLPLILFDYHSDNAGTMEEAAGDSALERLGNDNWIRYLQSSGIVGEIFWVYPAHGKMALSLAKPYFSADGANLSAILDKNRSAFSKGAILSFDMDYFANADPGSVASRAPAAGGVAASLENIFDELRARGIPVRLINGAYSRGYSTTAFRGEFGKTLSRQAERSSAEGVSPERPAQGPALFIDTRTEEREVRALHEDEHRILNDTLARIAFTGLEKGSVEFLTEQKVRVLFGIERDDEEARAPPEVRVIEDEALLEALPEQYKYLADGLITHAGTWRTDPLGRKHANIFLTRSVYEMLEQYATRYSRHEFREFWRRHELEHLTDRDKPIDNALSAGIEGKDKREDWEIEEERERKEEEREREVELTEWFYREHQKEVEGKRAEKERAASWRKENSENEHRIDSEAQTSARVMGGFSEYTEAFELKRFFQSAGATEAAIDVLEKRLESPYVNSSDVMKEYEAQRDLAKDLAAIKELNQLLERLDGVFGELLRAHERGSFDESQEYYDSLTKRFKELLYPEKGEFYKMLGQLNVTLGQYSNPYAIKLKETVLRVLQGYLSVFSPDNKIFKRHEFKYDPLGRRGYNLYSNAPELSPSQLDFLRTIRKATGEVAASAVLATLRLERGYKEATFTKDGAIFAMQNAIHPTLKIKDKFEPVGFMVPAEGKAVLISGLNTGGKSVTLKTAGIIALMTQCGLPIPADVTMDEHMFAGFVKAEVRGYDVDIGEASRFAAELAESSRLLRSLSPRTLAIIDDDMFGGSSEPAIVASCFSATVEGLSEHRVSVVAVTHHIDALEALKSKHPDYVFKRIKTTPGKDGADISTRSLEDGIAGSSLGLYETVRQKWPAAAGAVKFYNKLRRKYGEKELSYQGVNPKQGGKPARYRGFFYSNAERSNLQVGHFEEILHDVAKAVLGHEGAYNAGEFASRMMKKPETCDSALWRDSIEKLRSSPNTLALLDERLRENMPEWKHKEHRDGFGYSEYISDEDQLATKRFVALVKFAAESDVPFIAEKGRELKEFIEDSGLGKGFKEYIQWFGLEGVRGHIEGMYAGETRDKYLAAIDNIRALYGISALAHMSWPFSTSTNRRGEINIKGGWHSSLTKTVSRTPNDVAISLQNPDAKEGSLTIYTGFNTGGKSTLAKMIAQIVTLARMGWPVPAVSAEIGNFSDIQVVSGTLTEDKQRTRSHKHKDAIGGALAAALHESALVLQSATSNTLVILDEPFSGCTEPSVSAALTAAIAEDLVKKGATVILITHLLESVPLLTESIPQARTFKAKTTERDGLTVPLYHFEPGTALSSHGFEVAKGMKWPGYQKALEYFDLLSKEAQIGAGKQPPSGERPAQGAPEAQKSITRQPAPGSPYTVFDTLHRRSDWMYASEIANRITTTNRHVSADSVRRDINTLRHLRLIVGQRDTHGMPIFRTDPHLLPIDIEVILPILKNLGGRPTVAQREMAWKKLNKIRGSKEYADTVFEYLVNCNIPKTDHYADRVRGIIKHNNDYFNDLFDLVAEASESSKIIDGCYYLVAALGGNPNIIPTQYQFDRVATKLPANPKDSKYTLMVYLATIMAERNPAIDIGDFDLFVLEQLKTGMVDNNIIASAVVFARRDATFLDRIFTEIDTARDIDRIDRMTSVVVTLVDNHDFRLPPEKFLVLLKHPRPGSANTMDRYQNKPYLAACIAAARDLSLMPLVFNTLKASKPGSTEERELCLLVDAVMRHSSFVPNEEQFVMMAMRVPNHAGMRDGEETASGTLAFALLKNLRLFNVLARLNRVDLKDDHVISVKPYGMSASDPDLARFFDMMTNKGELKRLMYICSLLRLAISDALPEDSNKTPLEYAREKGLIMQYNDFIQICPVTESFRRHILIVRGSSGKEYQFEMKIPGQKSDKRWIPEIVTDLAHEWSASGLDIVKPVALFEAHGAFQLYHTIREYPENDDPLRVALYEYQDGRRLTRYHEHNGHTALTNGYLDRIARARGSTKKELCTDIAVQAYAFAEWVFNHGYIGNTEAGNDFHLENMRLLPNGRVISVADFGAYEKKDTTKAERAVAVMELLEPWLSTHEILFNEVETKYHANKRQSEPVSADAIKLEADRINKESLKLTRTIEDKTMICHIVTDSILPDMQLKEGVLNRLESKMRSPKFGEKIVALSVKNPDNAEEYMAKLEALKAQIESEYQGYKVQFDVACPRPEYVENIQKLGMQALAFKREGEGEIIQIEGIILALRALRTGSIASLISAYKTITGKDYTTDKADINELAKIMLFILPVRKIDVDKIGTINKLIEENIKAAA